MRGILTALLLITALGSKGQISDDQLAKVQAHQLGGLCFTVGGGALYFIADNQVRFADPGTIKNYKRLRGFAVGCVGLGLYLETVAYFKIKKARLAPTGTGLKLTIPISN